MAAGAAVAVVAAALAGCNATSGSGNKYGVTASPRVVAFGQPVPSGGGQYKVGRPYKIAGKTFVPREEPGYDRVGLASWYGADFHGRRTANGEIFDSTSLSAAHPTLPLPTYARVTNLDNGKSVVVRINDRGPFAHNRLIDLSKRTAEVLEFKHAGTAKVRVQYVGTAPLEGNDGQWLTTTVRHDGEALAPVMMASHAPQPSGDAGQYPQVAAVSHTTAAGAPPPMGFAEQPVQASFSPQAAPASGPVPRAPVGGTVTYRWVSGYSAGTATRDFVARTFGVFDGSRDIVLLIAVAPGAGEARDGR